MATTTCHDRTTRCISFSPDGKLLVAGGSDGRVVLLGCADWQERFAFPGNGDDVVNVAFSADGTTLAIANNEGDVKLIGPSTHNATAIMALCDIHIARKNWQAALEAINRAVEKSPNPPGALQSRASVYLGLGEWKKRQADVEKAIESETANHYAHYEHALLCLILNEAPKYRDACAAMVRKFGQSDDPTAAYWAAWTCVLAADAIDEYEPVLACTTKAVEAQPDSDQFLNTLGAILYRAGRHDEAIERLAVLDRRWKTADGAVQSSPAYTWYFLAMAHLKAGNEDQAREYLNKANQSTDDEFADKEKPPPWNRRATLELLRKEAEALLGTDVEKSAESNQRPEGEEK